MLVSFSCSEIAMVVCGCSTSCHKIRCEKYGATYFSAVFPRVFGFLIATQSHCWTNSVGPSAGPFIQVSSEYKMRSQNFEFPPTAQAKHARDLKFGMVGP